MAAVRIWCVLLGLVFAVAGCATTTVVGTPPASSPPSVAEGPRLPTVPAATARPDLPVPTDAAEVRQFIGAVFTDAQQQWQETFAAAGVAYRPARLVLFTAALRTGCGVETSKVGPFYCPADRTVYLDATFFDELQAKYGVGGDFAQAYVVAHEVGHHIQNMTGTMAQVARLERSAPQYANQLSVLQELQADCYAGVWAHSTYERGLLEPGDIDEALNAAAAVGDDFLQRTSTGTVRPENWTHGSSAQRQQWFTTGYQSGDPNACDTFQAARH
ncbi:MAG TPA: neutral zinc metallopeptidase [Pseudonocardiaceae bacterium]|nr:neutral zinc metallopeptidase [Pseudonocardiaceae bacterium]